jgi:hypothetical protein
LSEETLKRRLKEALPEEFILDDATPVVARKITRTIPVSHPDPRRSDHAPEPARPRNATNCHSPKTSLSRLTSIRINCCSWGRDAGREAVTVIWGAQAAGLSFSATCRKASANVRKSTCVANSFDVSGRLPDTARGPRALPRVSDSALKQSVERSAGTFDTRLRRCRCGRH